MADLRHDATTGRWVAIAPGRAERPGAAGSAADDPATCPFCSGNEDQTPPETLRLGDGSDRLAGPGRAEPLSGPRTPGGRDSRPGPRAFVRRPGRPDDRSRCRGLAAAGQGGGRPLLRDPQRGARGGRVPASLALAAGLAARPGPGGRRRARAAPRARGDRARRRHGRLPDREPCPLRAPDRAFPAGGARARERPAGARAPPARRARTAASADPRRSARAAERVAPRRPALASRGVPADHEAGRARARSRRVHRLRRARGARRPRSASRRERSSARGTGGRRRSPRRDSGPCPSPA